MNRFLYYSKRLISMNYLQMFKMINAIAKRSGKSRLWVFKDIIACSTKYLSGYMDYFVFHFEDLTEEQRSTFITRGVNNAYIRKMNNSAFYDKFDNKIEFNHIFKKFIKREYLDLTSTSLDLFEKFVKKHKIIIVKPVNMQCGKGIEKLEITKNTDLKVLYNQLLINGQTLVEEIVEQSEEMNKLFPNAVNTLRLVTARINGKTTVLFRAIRVGTGNNVVDNFNHGGIYTIVNEKGILEKPAIDKKGIVYELHPTTQTKIVGFQIPYFEKAIKMVKEASAIVPEVGLVGWDIAITDKGPVMIEGNQLPGYDIYQSKIHLNEDGTGMKPLFDKIIYSDQK